MEVDEFGEMSVSTDLGRMTIAAVLSSNHEMENRENPFKPDSNLSKETDDLLRHSTISRNQVILDDPTTYQNENQNQNESQGQNGIELMVAEKTALTDTSPQSVEVEVGIVAPSADSHMQVEHVNVKEKKKCSCCVVM